MNDSRKRPKLMPGYWTGRNEASGCPQERRSALPPGLGYPPAADSRNHPQGLNLPPSPPQPTGSTVAKKITHDKPSRQKLRHRKEYNQNHQSGTIIRVNTKKEST